jgi:ribosomal-protein-alanine N-acetyltransferase
MKIRPATLNDLADLHYLERCCNPTPWSLKQLEEALHNNHCMVACIAKRVVGMIVWQQIMDEAEIYLINTLPEMQRQGVGSRLLDYLIEYANGHPILKIFLEVREDNKGAQALYQRYGFDVIAKRKQYYRTPEGLRIDALIMEYVDAK